MARKVINVVYKVDDKELVKAKTSIQGVEKETKDAEKEMVKFDKATQKAGSDGQKSFNAFNSVLNKLSIAALTAAAIKLGKTIFDLGVKQEQLNIAFNTFLGSAEKAKKVIADLTKFAIVTPFTPDQVNGAAKALLAFGVQGEDLIPTLKMLGDVSAGTGKDLTEMAVIFGQIRSTGRLMGQDLLQLINAGFNPLQVISQKTGKSVRELKEEMEKGNISFEMVSDAFKTATSEGGLFFDLMEKQSKSIGGIVSTITGNIEEGFKNIFSAESGELADFVKELQTLSEAFLKFTKSQAQLDDELQKSTIDAYLEKFKSYRDVLKGGLSAEVAQADAMKFTNLAIEKRLRELEKLEQAEIDFINAQENNTAGDVFEKQAYERVFAIRAERDGLLNVVPAINEFIDAEGKVVKVVADVTKEIKKKNETLSDTENILPDNAFAEDAFWVQYRDQVDKGVNDVYDTWKAGNDAIEQENIQSWEAELEARSQALKDRIKLEEQAAERSKQLAFQLGQELLSNLLLENTISTDSIQEKYDREIELAGDNERAKKEIKLREKEELKKIEEENKQVQRRNAIRSILIDTAVSIIKTFSQFGFPAGVLPAALMAATGAAAAANVRKYKDGGINIDGAGTSTSDSIPAMLSKGESVINAQATSKSMNLLEAINDRKIDDSILYKLSTGGGRQANFDDSGIIKAIERNKVDYITQGYSLYQATQVGKNFKRTIRSKVQGY